MSHRSFFANRGIQVAITPDGGLNLKGLSDLSSDTRQEILTFAMDNKQAIVSELETPPPDLTRIQPDHVQEYITLWYQAHTLADYVDGGEAVAPYAERAAKLPELNGMVGRMRTIEKQMKGR